MQAVLKLWYLPSILRSNAGLKISLPTAGLTPPNKVETNCNYYPLRGRCGGGAAPSATNKFGRAEGTRPNLFSPQTQKINVFRHVSSSSVGTFSASEEHDWTVFSVANYFQSALFCIPPSGHPGTTCNHQKFKITPPPCSPIYLPPSDCPPCVAVLPCFCFPPVPPISPLPHHNLHIDVVIDIYSMTHMKIGHKLKQE